MNFEKLCDDALAKLSDAVEQEDKNSQLDVEYSDGILQITVEKTSETYIINRHSASQKIWYSSPISGADYFSFDKKSAKWLDSKGEELSQKLFLELKNLLSHAELVEA
jgi:iron donor protein CyaY